MTSSKASILPRAPLPALGGVTTLLLGPPGRQRLRTTLTLLSLIVNVTFAGMQHLEVMLGLIDIEQSNWLSVLNVSGVLAFYVVVRGGLSERMLSNQGLTELQIVYGLFAMAGSYAITGPARGVVLTLIVLILVFGMFALTLRQSRRLALLAISLIVVVMVWKSRTDPQHYPPSVELIHFIFALIVLVAVSGLAARMSGLRRRLFEQKAHLEQALTQIRVLATQDELTGLLNRRHMTELMSLEKARQSRSAQTMSLVLLDIDHFKRINDGHGHRAGDVVLQRFAQVGRRSLRSTDTLARWGGEEFLLMLPGTDAANALQCVERMRAEIDQLSFDAIAPGMKITFSAGLSHCGPDDALAAAIERADQAMYRAKALGRNCSIVA